MDASSTSFGEALNGAGGAVYAMLWTADGIKICTLLFYSTVCKILVYALHHI